MARQSPRAAAAAPPGVVVKARSPARLGGASMPPPSPTNTARFSVEPVGIPTSKPPRKIKNLDESTWEDGYDSDGELGPFLDAVAGQTTRGVEEEDEGFIPASMGGDG
eukprot:CAMPEP_0113569148 /NCGR_PEP_ID=MMETSP0015_2-20120614/24244_1 /TAXON_ID=2838 /ORGANISM="Odontella" /LENGTH=107 /DNA_ID=CAMNT_0000471769 /DNA_START=156 /DNA_END=476 /DNA_ORIENTATION=- /assembly_acc=CAM_ASM_000160